MINKKRFELIIKEVSGKDVLDVGCIDHNAMNELSHEWLHKIIVDNAKKVVGLDLEEEEAQKLQEKGYDIVIGNAEAINLNKKFDVVVAGELIEHLSNPGKFLGNMKNHLRKDGVIIMTTPNPFYPKRIFEILLYKKVLVHPQHVMWLCPSTLKTILEREGYSDVEIIPFNNTERFSVFVNWLTGIRPWFSNNLFVRAKI